jgi:uncharacterized protein
MKILIIGATGLIGNAVGRYFTNNGCRVIGFTRNNENFNKLETTGLFPAIWNGYSFSGSEDYLEKADAIVNLAGDNISTGRWTRTKKKRILQSRLQSVQALSDILTKLESPPSVVIQASAIGFYGPRNDESLTENAPPGKGFLAEVVSQWEQAAESLEQNGIRTVIIRTGVVLDKHRGAFKKMIRPFQFFFGGPIGSGKQWMSWIHIEDVVQCISFLIKNKSCRGIFNLTAPNPVQNKEFAHQLGRALHRPSFLPVPAPALKLLLGEMADQLLLTGQRVLPVRLQEHGYSFLFPDLPSALKQLL